MKHFFPILVLQSISVAGICQTSKEPTANREKLEQYLWSYSKNKAISVKALVDFDAINNWRMLEGNTWGYLSVSNDGKYFAYTINKYIGTRYRGSGLDSLVLQSTKINWRRAFAGSKQGFFSADGKQYIFQNGNDLWFQQLGSQQFQTVKNIASYKVNENKTWIAWQVKGSDSLILRNLATEMQRSFSGIKDYNFDNQDGWFVCNNKTKDLLLYNLVTNTEKKFSNVEAYSLSANGKGMLLSSASELRYVDVLKGDLKTIWTANENTALGIYNIDGAGQQVLFTTEDSVDASKSGVWYYKAGKDKTVLKINNHAHGGPPGFATADAMFTDNGKYIQLSVKAKPVSLGKPADNISGVEVWNYKDPYLQSAQSKRLNTVAAYIAIANIDNGKVVFVESVNKKVCLLKGDFALVKTDYKEEQGDRFWEEGSYRDSVWIVSLKNGSSHLLPTKTKSKFWFSPDGNWLVYFDASKGCRYYSYALHNGTLKSISANVPENQLTITGSDESNTEGPKDGSLAAWIEGSNYVLVYDSYDIWKLDLTGSQPAVNITNGIGQRTKTVLNLYTTDRYSSEVPIIKAKEALMLRAFNMKTKQSGFYQKVNLSSSAPTELYMGSYFMNKITGCHDLNLSNDGMAPMKAKNSEVWIVQRQSATDAPNYYETTDFKNFKKLTNFQPQAQFRWLTQELHSFKHLDGRSGQGILYKPEGFDPARKYPVVIAFYGAFSNNMYQFPAPNYLDQSMAAGISPAWFLSNGFLVFTPDIAVTPLKYGPKAFSCIEGAAKYLQHLSFVDANKLGYSSHSFSSQLGAYLFTHSTTFSAAAITEGLSYGNVISNALSVKKGESNLESIEVGRDAGNLWENKEAWLDQTTVLNIDKAKAPLLLLCNKNSSENYQDQTVQLFTALRRLNKMAWWLKYDNGDHTLRDLKELKDYTIRYTQFFDHYLKNAPAPQWMTEGIPYKLKSIESRYELDPQGQCNSKNGEPCLICQAWNKQYNKTPEMFQKEIKDWELDKEIADELERKQNERRKELDKQGAIQTKQVMEMLKK